MAWNPDTYNKFKSERFAPFYDLSALIKVRQGMDIIDLGCGTGALTRKLADMLPDSDVLGIDSSPEMLHDSKAFGNKQVRFACKPIEEQIRSDQKWDLVFSNAALQWVENHETLLPAIISTLNANGQLVIQIPAQHHNSSNKLLSDLANEEPFRTTLQNRIRVSPVLDMETYAKIFFENGSKSMTVYEKIYPLIVPDTNALLDWVSGTAMIPYLEKLEGETRQDFIQEYQKRLAQKFEKSPVFYPFKRIIMEATF